MNPHTVESHRGIRIELHYDTDPSNPRKDDNMGTMECWHRRYDLGDETHTGSYNHQEFLESLLHDAGVSFSALETAYEESLEAIYANKALVGKAESDAIASEVREYNARLQDLVDAHYVILGLSLLDHSGLHMWCGHSNHWSDSAGWDSGPIGWIYCSLSKAQENWSSAKGEGWDAKVKNGRFGEEYTPDGVGPLGGHIKVKDTDEFITLRQAVERGLRCEVETYDQYLTGDVHGYILKAEVDDEDHDYDHDDDLDSCWGFYGLDYCLEEAKSAADHHARKLETEASNEATRNLYTASPSGAD